MSFEAKIALALGGSSWQSLQKNNTTEPGSAVDDGADHDEEADFDDDDDDDDDEDDGIPLEDENADPTKTEEPLVDAAQKAQEEARAI